MNEEAVGKGVVTDQGKGSTSDLWKKEDYWAIWLGFFILILGLIIYLPSGPSGYAEKIEKANATLKAESEKAPFKTIAWYDAVAAKRKLRATSSGVGKAIKTFTGTPHGWKANPFQSFYRSKSSADASNEKAQPAYDAAKQKADDALAKAKTAEEAAAAAGFKDEKLNAETVSAIDDWRAAQAKASKIQRNPSTYKTHHGKTFGSVSHKNRSSLLCDSLGGI